MESNRNRLAASLERECDSLCRTMSYWLTADPSLGAQADRGHAWWERRARILLHHFTHWLAGRSPQGPARARPMLAPARVPQIFRSSILETLDELGALSREERSEAGRLIDQFIGLADPVPGGAGPAGPGQNAPDAPRRS